jgi:hypothetical protein
MTNSAVSVGKILEGIESSWKVSPIPTLEFQGSKSITLQTDLEDEEIALQLHHSNHPQTKPQRQLLIAAGFLRRGEGHGLAHGDEGGCDSVEKTKQTL